MTFKYYVLVFVLSNTVSILQPAICVDTITTRINLQDLVASALGSRRAVMQ